MNCLISLQSKGLSRVFSNITVQKHQFFGAQLSTQSNSYSYSTTGKTIALTRWTFVGKVMSLLFNMLSRLVITFLPRNKRLLISWLQSPSAVILEPQKIACHCFHCFPIYLPWSDGTRCHDLHDSVFTYYYYCKGLWLLREKECMPVASNASTTTLMWSALISSDTWRCGGPGRFLAPGHKVRKSHNWYPNWGPIISKLERPEERSLRVIFLLPWNPLK